MMIIGTILISIYILALVLIFFYALAQLNLLINYISYKKKHKNLPKPDLSVFKTLPYVTIQLPLYNEKYVVERLLKNIAKVEYPRNRLEIQVLDDSTDESIEITEKIIHQLQNEGLDIKHIKRKERKNFKAGALKEGLKTAKGEFIAIFDADFLPQKEWLTLTLPYFIDKNIGAVQTRWGHINKDYSLLTKVQAFALDLHFTLEQVGRNSKKHFINFNGTAGIWRKECILDAGNWQGDTLTEDLDLSYRAQLKKWSIHYLEEVVTPAELPVVISAARSQQFRWNKGGAENFRKMIKNVYSAKHLPLTTKLHASFHLLNSSVFFSVFVIALLSIPVLYFNSRYFEFNYIFYLMSFFLISTLIFFTCYWVAYKKVNSVGFTSFFRFIGLFFSFFSIAMGFSWNNTLAILEGHMGKKSDFIRTPKFNVNTITDKWKGNAYISSKLTHNTFIEGLLVLYFAFGLFWAFTNDHFLNNLSMIAFHLMLFAGFSYVFFNSIFSRA